MELKLYEWNEKEERYDYCGGYLTFNSYNDLTKYLYILMCDLFYDSFTIELLVDLRPYDEVTLKEFKDNACICLFRTTFCSSSKDYKICICNNSNK